MPSSENIVGFSTGAISKGDFRAALDLLRRFRIGAVELSALRRKELPQLVEAFASLDLSGFSYISVHAPSRFDSHEEAAVIEELSRLPESCQWIIVHPDVISDPNQWRRIEERLAIENMDTRKPAGRTPGEMHCIFEKLPGAKSCLDLAHAEKVDPTMYAAQTMIREFRDRIVQVHLSEITTAGDHRMLSIQGIEAAQRVAKLIPSDVPVILESPASEAAIMEEIGRARRIFHPALEDLKRDIGAMLQAKNGGPEDRRRLTAETFLRSLQRSNAGIRDSRAAILNLPHGGPGGRGQTFLSARDLYDSLTETERKEIDEYYRVRLELLLSEFPDLATAAGA